MHIRAVNRAAELALMLFAFAGAITNLYASVRAFERGSIDTVFCSVSCLCHSDLKSWQSAAYAIAASNPVISLTVMLCIRDYLRLRFNRYWARRATRYSYFTIPGSIAIGFMGLDRIFVNILLATAARGLYNGFFTVNNEGGDAVGHR